MIHDDIDAFFQTLKHLKALAGLDLGSKTIGVAVSDHLKSVATPLETIKRTKFTKDAERLVEVVVQHTPSLLG